MMTCSHNHLDYGIVQLVANELYLVTFYIHTSLKGSWNIPRKFREACSQNQGGSMTGGAGCMGGGTGLCTQVCDLWIIRFSLHYLNGRLMPCPMPVVYPSRSCNALICSFNEASRCRTCRPTTLLRDLRTADIFRYHPYRRCSAPPPAASYPWLVMR